MWSTEYMAVPLQNGLFAILLYYINHLDVKEIYVMKKVSGYYVNRHSCFMLSYHLVLVTKYRKPVLEDEVKSYVYSLIRKTLEERNCIIVDMNGEPDHVHVLFDAPPDFSPQEVVNVVKTRTSRLTRKNYPDTVSKHYWKPYFWSYSYFIAPVGDNTRSLVEAYTRNQ